MKVMMKRIQMRKKHLLKDQRHHLTNRRRHLEMVSEFTKNKLCIELKYLISAAQTQLVVQSGGGMDEGFTCDECGRWHRTRNALQNHIKSVHQHDEDNTDLIRLSNDTACLRLARASMNDLCRDYQIVNEAVDLRKFVAT